MSGRPLLGTVIAIVIAGTSIAASPAIGSPPGSGMASAVRGQVNGFPGAGILPKSLDRDRDGLSNKAERRIRTDPRKADTDGEGLTDLVELKKTKTNPRQADTDSDGLTDWIEVNRTKTNPRKADSDGDGVSDGVEVYLGTDPWAIPPPIPPAPSPPPSPRSHSPRSRPTSLPFLSRRFGPPRPLRRSGFRSPSMDAPLPVARRSPAPGCSRTKAEARFSSSARAA